MLLSIRRQRHGLCDGTLFGHRLRVAASAVAFAFVVGCGRSGPVVEMVEGMVLLDGAPLSGVTIGFSPVTPAAGLAASGVSGPDGGFRLTAVTGGLPGSGTAVGEYVVTCSKTERISDPPTEDRPAAPLKIRHVVPEAYGVVATSSLKATVKKGLNKGDAFRFDLKSDYRPK